MATFEDMDAWLGAELSATIEADRYRVAGNRYMLPGPLFFWLDGSTVSWADGVTKGTCANQTEVGSVLDSHGIGN